MRTPNSFRERDGVELSVAFGDKADSGDTTVVTVAAGDIVKVYGISISADATLTGTVHAEVGSTQITVKARKLITGGAHWIFPITGSYYQGALGEDVIINNSAAESISYAVYYITVKP